MSLALSVYKIIKKRTKITTKIHSGTKKLTKELKFILATHTDGRVWTRGGGAAYNQVGRPSRPIAKSATDTYVAARMGFEPTRSRSGQLHDLPFELRSLLMAHPSKFYISLKSFFVRDWAGSA